MTHDHPLQSRHYLAMSLTRHISRGGGPETTGRRLLVAGGNDVDSSPHAHHQGRCAPLTETLSMGPDSMSASMAIHITVPPARLSSSSTPNFHSTWLATRLSRRH
jgi:hypothetical protein